MEGTPARPPLPELWARAGRNPATDPIVVMRRSKRIMFSEFFMLLLPETGVTGPDWCPKDALKAIGAAAHEDCPLAGVGAARVARPVFGGRFVSSIKLLRRLLALPAKSFDGTKPISGERHSARISTWIPAVAFDGTKPISGEVVDSARRLARPVQQMSYGSPTLSKARGA